MNKEDLRIVFLGTPEFAVASLDALVKNGFNVVGVITAPDKPAGRGMQMQQSAVKQYAVANDIKVLQPEKLKNPEFIEELKSLQANLQIVVAFRMLPEMVWNMPSLGTINVHGSLLPQYRGAAPINWCIINGEKQTGVTTFKLQHEIDTGNILMHNTIDIDDEMTAGQLHDEMKEVGANTLVSTLQHLLDNSLKEHQQNNLDPSTLKHAPKIFTETCKIDFSKSVDEVYNLIRGLSPYPTAFTFLKEKKLKIFECSKETIQHNKEVGSFETDNKTVLKVSCSNGFILINDLQLEGKKRMLVADFLRGFKL